MSDWSKELEEELAILLKEWLKQQGRTQADLRKSLQALSTRMPALIEVLKIEYSQGGVTKLAMCLCKIEEDWSKIPPTIHVEEENSSDPLGQLDLLLEEIRDDCAS